MSIRPLMPVITSPNVGKPARTGRMSGPARLACLLILVLSADAALLAWFRAAPPVGAPIGVRCAAWLDRTVGVHPATVLPYWGSNTTVTVQRGHVVRGDPADLRTDILDSLAIYDPLPGILGSTALNRLELPLIVVPVLYHLGVVMIWQAGRWLVAARWFPHRRVARPSLDSVLSNATFSAVLAIPALAFTQFLWDFWAAAPPPGGSYYRLNDRGAALLVGLSMAGVCWQLYAIGLAARFTRWPRHHQHAPTGACAACGYPVGGPTVAICPECGHAIGNPVPQRGGWMFGKSQCVLIVLGLLFSITPMLMLLWSLIV